MFDWAVYTNIIISMDWIKKSSYPMTLINDDIFIHKQIMYSDYFLSNNHFDR